MGDFNPKLPTRHTGTNKYITFFVTRNRSPTGADYRQPETGTLYSIGTVWQTAKNPTTGVEGDLWMLSKIVANVAYWVRISGGSIGPLLAVDVQASTAPGVDPVTPDGLGVMTINGAVVANHSVVLETHTRALNEFNIEVQYATAVAATDGTKSGVSHFNSADFTVDASGFVTLGGVGATQTLTPNEDFDGSVATPISPQAGNINILGSNPSFATVTETYNTTGASTGNLDIEHRAWVTGLVVDTSTTPGSRGTFSTITAAMAAAVPGQTVFLRTSVTENFTIKPGVNIASWYSESVNTPAIIGTITMSGAGVSTISGVKLQTNGAALLVVTGNAASFIGLKNCYLNCTDFSGITFNSSSASAGISIRYCGGNLGTTGIAFFTHTSPGGMGIDYSKITNTGLSTTASTCSSGIINMEFTTIDFPVTTSGTSAFTWDHLAIDCNGINTTAATLGGSGLHDSRYSRFLAGTASAVSISSTTTSFSLCTIGSNNTNAVTGAGSIVYSGMIFEGLSRTINTTTQAGSGTLRGSLNTAPSAGFLGEQISSAVTAVGIASATPTSITSISITAGVWDVYLCANCTSTANTATAFVAGISATNNTFEGNDGDKRVTFNAAIAGTSLIGFIPAYRLVLSATTTYYLVSQVNFLGGTASVSGRISANRVG